MHTSLTALDSTDPSSPRRARRTGAEGKSRTDAPDRREDAERFRRYRATGDRGLRNQLIDDHRWLALHCAKRFANKGEPLDDLIQVAARRAQGRRALRPGLRRHLRHLRRAHHHR